MIHDIYLFQVLDQTLSKKSCQIIEKIMILLYTGIYFSEHLVKYNKLKHVYLRRQISPSSWRANMQLENADKQRRGNPGTQCIT